MNVKAITVCVGYDDFLKLTLPRIVMHVTKLLVVTSPDDVRTKELVLLYPDKVELFVTDAFYRDGAHFNKGLAMEEGFDVLGRSGWILVLDADIVLPEVIPPLDLTVGKMYTPSRRIMSNVDGLTETPTVSPDTLPLRYEVGNFGYFQLFHADDPAITTLPWYGIDWNHAGGCDSVFEKRWDKSDRLRMPFEVIHLGDPDANWYGRTRPRIDNGEVHADADARRAKQEALHRKYGWKGRKRTGEHVVERLNGDPGAEACHMHDEKKKHRLHAERVAQARRRRRG